MTAKGKSRKKREAESELKKQGGGAGRSAGKNSVKAGGRGRTSSEKRKRGRKTAEKSAASRSLSAAPSSDPEKASFREELLLLLALSLSIFLFLSNLGLCGPVGDLLRDLQFGVFGLLGGLLPFVLFFTTALLLFAGEDQNSSRRLCAALLFLLFLGAFLQLTAGGGVAGKDIREIYEEGASGGVGGGAVGGGLALLLWQAAGQAGALFLLFMGMLFCLVYASGRPLLALFMGFSAGKVREAEEGIRRLSSASEAGRRTAPAPAAEREFTEIDLLQGEKTKPEGLPPEEKRSGEESEEKGILDSFRDFIRGEESKGKEDAAEDSSASSLRIKGLPQEESSRPTEEKRDQGGEKEKAEGGRKEIELPVLPGRRKRVQPAEDYLDSEPDYAKYGMWIEPEDDAWGHRGGMDEDAGPSLPLTEAAGPSGVRRRRARMDSKRRRGIRGSRSFPSVSDGADIAKEGAGTESVSEEELWIDEKEALSRELHAAAPDPVRLSEERDREKTEESRKAADPSPRETSESFGKEEREKLPRKGKEHSYHVPPLSFLKTGGAQGADSREEIERNALTLQKTLESFGVGVSVSDVSVGPAVTRYELQPEQGVKVSRIVSLSNDIKMRLAASDIRIEAPIPGKSAVGIEVPNRNSQTVYLGDILSSAEFRNAKMELSFGVGKDIEGKTVVTDIAKMPHLLIAGATGSGKSVSINTLIMSLIYRYSPEEVRMIMVDPKVVELQVYNGIPHLLIPVVTDPKKAAAALNWAVAEMSDRYKKFAEAGVRDLKGYNRRIAELGGDAAAEKLPKIVIIIDELADLMMVSAQEVEEAICRIAQLARACGMHLVIATQRPSVNVITGLIKANVPSRIAFAVSSGVDSRTIIDMNGAEKLLGKGDMLFFPQGIPKPVRVQGAFVSDQEVQDAVEYLKEHTESDYSEELSSSIENPLSGESRAESDRDELFREAGELVTEAEKASIGMLQRRFRIGFNRAARIMDQLSDYGVVGAEEGTKGRKVQMTKEEFLSFLSEREGESAEAGGRK